MPAKSHRQSLRYYLDLEHQNKKKKPFDFTGWVNHSPDVRVPVLQEARELIVPLTGYPTAGEWLRLWCLHLPILGDIVSRRRGV